MNEQIEEETFRLIDEVLEERIREAERMASLKHNKKVLLDRLHKLVEKMLKEYPHAKYRILNVVREEYNLAYDEEKEWLNERNEKILVR